jgi:ribosomal protein S18 acetylase RimI-like enzyme
MFRSNWFVGLSISTTALPLERERFAGRASEAPHDVRVLDYVRNPPVPDDWLAREYPGHLHINILPHVQSGGWGRKLIETELDSQRAAGAPGVHLGVSPTNYRAIGFYQHVGFTRLDALPGVVFGRKLA